MDAARQAAAPSLPQAVAHDRTGSVRHDVSHALVVGGGHDGSVGGHETHDPPEGVLHVLEVAVDVGVVELDGRDDEVRAP